MRLLENAGAGDGPAYSASNLEAKEYRVVIWGTITSVDLEISPDQGTTWLLLANLTGAGITALNIAGKEGYQIRGSVNTGSGVYLDIL